MFHTIGDKLYYKLTLWNRHFTVFKSDAGIDLIYGFERWIIKPELET